MEKLPVEIEELFHEAEGLIASEDSAQQVIVVRTAQAHTYSLLNHNIMCGDLTEEESFINELVASEDTEIKYLVCMWHSCEIDIPSQNMRRLLVEINPLNKDMVILLRGEEKYIVKPLWELGRM